MGERIDRVCVSGPYEEVDPGGNYCRSEDVDALEAEVERLKVDAEALTRLRGVRDERDSIQQKYMEEVVENRRLRDALVRLGSMEGFDLGRAISETGDKELLARISFARKAVEGGP